MNLGTHIIKFPSGKYGFVGTINTNLCNPVPAERRDILANAITWRDADGTLLAWRTPCFASATDAVEHAFNRDVPLCDSPDCACRKLF